MAFLFLSVGGAGGGGGGGGGSLWHHWHVAIYGFFTVIQ